MAESSRKGARTLPSRTSSFAIGHPRGSKNQAENLMSSSRDGSSRRTSLSLKKHIKSSPVYARMQSLVQRMLHSDHGVPIKNHKKNFISSVPSAFTGSDIVNWLMKNLSTQSKAEAIHLANLLCRQGFFFAVECNNPIVTVRDDGTLYRFQTPYFWPSQDPNVSDYEYGVYLVKQVLRSKDRINLLDYELKNLHKLKLRLAREWRTISAKAEENVKVFSEQKRVARTILASQEEAFWRIHRPRPGDSSAQDSALTRHGTDRLDYPSADKMTREELIEERNLLRRMLKKPTSKVSTAIERMMHGMKTYAEFDPMITPPEPSNPWITGDMTMWELDKSLVEIPTERRVTKWSCSLYDLLHDVTGRFKFEAYCKSQYNLENVKFWQACNDLQTIPLHAVSGSVQLIYDEFLQKNAPSEVNLSAAAMDEVHKDLKNPSRYSFTVAKEEIYKLIENDIYPRFLKSDEFKSMLKKAKEAKAAGKGFFAKLQKKKLDSGVLDATEISPCLPHRFARSKLSITRRSSLTSGGSSSLDNIFRACSDNTSDHAQSVQLDKQRRSAYTEDFISQLTSPSSGNPPCAIARSRSSGPQESAPKKASSTMNDVVEEEEEDELDVLPATGVLPGAGLSNMGPMSFSADNLPMLLENSDVGLSSRWRLLGLNAVSSSGFPDSTPDRPETLGSGNTVGGECMTPRLMLTSPKHGFYEFDSADQSSESNAMLTISNASLNSNSSH